MNRKIKKDIENLYDLVMRREKLEQELCHTLSEIAILNNNLIFSLPEFYQFNNYIVTVDQKLAEVRVMTKDEYEKSG